MFSSLKIRKNRKKAHCFASGHRIFILLCVIFTSSALCYAYDPPIGIPEPPFGIDETVASVYGSADYYTYYVDNTHANATDSNNPNGSPARPRRSIPTSLSAGDVVQVHGGPYTPSGSRFSFTGTGTQSQPIIVTGKRAAAKPLLTKFIHIPDMQWFIFENFRIQTSAGAIDCRPLNNSAQIQYISIRNCDVIGNGNFKSQQMIGASNNYYSQQLRYIVFYNNTSRDVGDYDSPTECDTCCFSVQHRCDHVWILENTGFRSGGDGVILAHGANFSTHHIYIGRNTFYQNRENGIDLKQANDVIVSENTIYNHRPVSSSPGEGIVVHYEPRRIWILYNKVYDCDLGIVTTGSSETYIIGNVISNIRCTGGTFNPTSVYSRGAAIQVRNSGSIYIVNNTLHDYDAGIQCAPSTSYDIKNNIFSNRRQADGFDILIPSSTVASNSHMDYNLFCHSNGGARIGWGDTRALDLNTFKNSHSPEGANCQTTNDLMFIGDSVHPFLIGTTSPAVDNGVAHDGYNLFTQTYSSYGNNSISFDVRKVVRPINAKWDIGAYEALVNVGPISSPPNVRLIK